MRLASMIAAASAYLALPVAAHAAPPAKFLADAIKGDNSEMTLGGVAAQRGGSAGVRSFGRMLRTDHAKAKANATAIARREHVAIPAGMMPEARIEYAKLQRLSGSSFDREFARYMVDDHRKDITEFEQQVRSGDRMTATLARRTLPALRRHLATAQGLSA